MTRNDVSFEKKYRYLLYRVQQALREMEVEPRQHRGRRHLENGLYTCEGFTSTDDEAKLVTHEEMTAIKKEIFVEKESEMDGGKLRIEDSPIDWGHPEGDKTVVSVFTYDEARMHMLKNWDRHRERLEERKQECLAMCKTEEERNAIAKFIGEYEAENDAQRKRVEKFLEEGP